ncbi:hypothetical protein LPJ61_005181, partial [Coemansia biformis]
VAIVTLDPNISFTPLPPAVSDRIASAMVAAPDSRGPICIIAIYAPAAASEREAFTTTLQTTIDTVPCTRTIVAGDFNTTPNDVLDRPAGSSNSIPWAPLASCMDGLFDITRV